MHPFYLTAWEALPTNQTQLPIVPTRPPPIADFQYSSPIVSESNSRKRPCKSDNGEEEEDESKTTECPICLKGVDNRGAHRLVATKCGHTFGESCILRWITEKQRKKSTPRCPNCGQNGPALKRADLQHIITTTLIAHDTSDFERIRNELNEARKLVEQKDVEIFRLKGQISLMAQSSKNLRELEAKLAEKSNPKPMEIVEEKKRLVEYYTYPLEYQRTGRSLAINPVDEMAVISVGNEVRGYGLQRLSLRDIGSVEYISVHTGVIRDIKCSPFQQSLVLSTGLDKQLALTCMNNQHVLLKYPTEKAGWSCAFDESDPNILYCGLANNTVLIFDNRNTNTHLQQLHPDGPNAAIHSLSVTKTEAGRMLLCSNTLGSYAWELGTSGEPVHHSLPSVERDGYKPYSLSYDTGTQTALISSRRMATQTSRASTTHSLYRFDPSHGQFEQSWFLESPHQQIQLARTCHFSPTGTKDDVVACYANESTVFLQSETEKIGSIPIHDTLMDVKAKQLNHGVVVGALTEKKLYLYNYQ